MNQIHKPRGPYRQSPSNVPSADTVTKTTSEPVIRQDADGWERPAKPFPGPMLGRDGPVPPLRPDPEKMQRVFRNEDLVRVQESDAGVENVSAPPRAVFDPQAPFNEGSPEYEYLHNLARVIRPDQAEAIASSFLLALSEARARRPARWRRRSIELDPEWFMEPWYALDARNFWMKGPLDPGGFEAIAEGLAHIARLGFTNILLANHYETESVSGANGVTLHAPGHDLGGAGAFARMIESADALGLRIVTSAAFHRTSVFHPWFSAAGQPHCPQSRYYQEASAHEVRRRTRSSPNPSLPRSGPEFASAAPGTAELDLSCPRLLKEVLGVLGDELNIGVLGKRSPSLRYSAPGQVGYALRGLLKLFMVSIAPSSAFIIHSRLGCDQAPALIGGVGVPVADATTEQGDLVYAPELSIALRESLYTGDRTPLETWVRRLPELPRSSSFLAYIEDELSVSLNLTSDPDLWRQLAAEHGGLVSPDGRYVALRHGSAIHGATERIALSLFVLYMLPATPLVQYGTELGAVGALEKHGREQARRTSFIRARAEHQDDEIFYNKPPILRTPLTATVHARGLSEDHRPAGVLQELNHQRRHVPALRSRTVTLLPIPDRSVLLWTRGRDDQARLMVANLSGQERRIQISTRDIPDRALETIARGTLGPRVRSTLSGEEAQLELAPYGWGMA